MSHSTLLTHTYEHKNQQPISFRPIPVAATFFIDRGIVEEPVKMEQVGQAPTTTRRKRHAAIHPLVNPLNASNQEAPRYVSDQLQQQRDSGVDVDMNGPRSAPLMVSSTVHEAIRRMRNEPEDESDDEEHLQSAPEIPARPLLKRRNAVRLPIRDIVDKLMESQSFPPPLARSQLQRRGAIRAKPSTESNTNTSGLLPADSVPVEQWPKMDRVDRPFSFVEPEAYPEKAMPSVDALVTHWIDQVQQPEERPETQLPSLDAEVKQMLYRMHGTVKPMKTTLTRGEAAMMPTREQTEQLLQDRVKKPEERLDTSVLPGAAVVKLVKPIVTREQVEPMPTREEIEKMLKNRRAGTRPTVAFAPSPRQEQAKQSETRSELPLPPLGASVKPVKKMLTREEVEKLTRGQKDELIRKQDPDWQPVYRPAKLPAVAFGPTSTKEHGVRWAPVLATTQTAAEEAEASRATLEADARRQALLEPNALKISRPSRFVDISNEVEARNTTKEEKEVLRDRPWARMRKLVLGKNGRRED
jgi:hypothetical protein